MKLTVALLLAACLQVSAKSNAQTISISQRNTSLEKVFKEIHRITGYQFFYQDELLRQAKKFDINVKDATLEQVLHVCFRDQPLIFTITEKTITINRKEEVNVYRADPPIVFADITGKVTDENGSPLAGVSVSVAGVKGGVSTDGKGNFLIAAPENAVLSFTYVGYKTITIPVKGRNSIEITMAPEISSMNDVVVVGYGVQKKKTLTGAVASVGENELRTATDANAASRLQGRVAGVTVTNDNSPGGETTVRVRGYGSVNNNNPLYVVDGVLVTGGLSQINPNDIESMTVLKDASSSAIYGTRAANGVIIITTKRGKLGLTLSLDARSGIQAPTNQLKMANAQEYAEITWLEFKNAGLQVGDAGWGSQQYGYGAAPVIPDYIFPTGGMDGSVDESAYSYPSPYRGITRANKNGTNWFDEIFDPALFQEYNLSMRGGTEKGKYALSVGYTDQKGAVIHTGFKRYSMRANVDGKITDWLEFGQSLGIAVTDRVSFGNNSADNPVSMAYRMQPVVPVYDIMGNYAGTQAATTGDGENPVATLFRDKDDINRQLRILGSAYVQSRITKNLIFKSLIGIDYSSSRGTNRDLANPESIKARLTDNLTQTYGGGNQYNWANTLNYSNTFNADHKLNVLIGSEAVNNTSESVSGGRSQFAFTDLDYMVLNAGESNQVSNGTFDQWKTFSYFGRLNYSYDDKYLVEGVVRRDGSSRFDPSSRWGTFPALSAGWVLSREAFMANIAWINELKLRGGWGKNGNDNVGNYNSYSTFRSAGATSYYNVVGASNTASQAGFYQYRLGNRVGRWEATTTTNIGADLSMFNRRFELNLDVFTRTTSDMLYPDSKPDTWGALLLPSVNIGEMKNKGFDLMLTYRSKPASEFRYTISANLSHYKNEVVKLNNNPNEIFYGSDLRGERYTISQEGQPFSSLYGLVVEGIFNTQDEVDKHPKFNPSVSGVDSYSKPGVFKYKDVNGDGIISPNDRTIIGNPHPDFSYGLNIDLGYKNFDMAMFFQGLQGNDVVNYVSRWTDFQQFQDGRSARRLYESWTSERYESGAKISMPMALANDAPMQKPSSFFVEDGSYLRMKNFQVGYTLPNKIVSRWKLTNMRFYFQVSNLFTITKYKGLDAENRAGEDLNMGVDQGVYPTMRMTMLGVNLSL